MTVKTTVTRCLLSAVIVCLALAIAANDASKIKKSSQQFADSTVQTIQSTGEIDANADENKQNDKDKILIPHYDEISCKKRTGSSDFDFYNPKENNCFLRVSITIKDTGETLYTSNLITPSNRVSQVILYPVPEVGEYPSILKVDAYAIEKMSYINSLIIDVTLKVK